MSTHFERVRDECHELLSTREDGKRFLDPHRIVEWAADHPQSALHQEFTWDDREAADAYRLEEARRLIQRIVIYIPGPKGQETEYREYINVPFNGDRGYQPIVDLAKDPIARRRAIVQVLRRALAESTNYPFAELAGWREETRRLIEQFSEEPPLPKRRAVKRRMAQRSGA